MKNDQNKKNIFEQYDDIDLNRYSKALLPDDAEEDEENADDAYDVDDENAEDADSEDNENLTNTSLDARALLRIYTISVLGRWLASGWENGWIRFEDDDVRAGWPDELRHVFSEKNLRMILHFEEEQDTFNNWPGMSFSQFWNQMVLNALNGDKLADRWCDLAERLDLKTAEVAALSVLVCIQYDLGILRALRFASADPNAVNLRWGFLTRLVAFPDKYHNEAVQVLHPRHSHLFREFILCLDEYNDNDNAMLSDCMVTIMSDVADYLYGYERQSPELFPKVDVDAADDLPDDKLQELIQAAEISTPPRVIISGPEGVGKFYATNRLARLLEHDYVYKLDLQSDSSIDTAKERIQRARAISTLTNAVIAVNDVSKWQDAWGNLILPVMQSFEETIQPLVWLVTGDVPDWIHASPQANIVLKMPQREDRYKIWERELMNALDNKHLDQLAGQFLLTRGQIHRAAMFGMASDYTNEEEFYKNLCEEARKLAQFGLGSLATPEPARVTRDQLIISEECRTALDELIIYAKHRKALAREWGFERSMPYGLGLAALFTGPPGTGKTYGAQVIATELQLELYRVDLSQIMSKYIGETEKQLAQLFNAAEQGEIMLLFDEADSVFSKRTQVKSSNDRYANLEINYLLQRMERFSGISILTSNFDNSIDEAFMRRIRFKVPFDIPDEKARLTLWNKFLSPAIPRAQDVNLKFLADIYELSGGHIKEAVLRAASIAFASNNRIVTQELLIKSIHLEFKKLGKLLPARGIKELLEESAHKAKKDAEKAKAAQEAGV